MLEGSLTGGETMMMAGVAPPHVESRSQQANNSTTLVGRPFYENHIKPQKYEVPTIAGVESFAEPTTTETPQFSDWNEADINRFMKDLETQGTLPKKNEAINEVAKNIPQEVKKSQGFWAKILDWFNNFFK